jgi:UDP:flavonoid glycosyltransferase YjiC (YdhE family)
MSGRRHMVFVNIAATGHMNSTLPLVAELVARGCKVTYLVDASKQDVVEALGAEWRPFCFTHHPELASAPNHLDDFAISTLIQRKSYDSEMASSMGECSGPVCLTIQTAETSQDPTFFSPRCK